jgi:hypothetical protein
VPARSERVILGLCVVAAAGHAVFYLALSLQRVGYPFELEWMESGSLEHLMRVLRGQPLYVEPSIDFVPFPYPPFYYYVAALVSKGIGPGFLALRTVSVVASLGSAAIIQRFVQKETGRSVYGWIAAGIFLGTWRASGLYFDVARLDSLFTFLLLVSLYAIRFHRGRADLVVAAMLAGLAVMTKQTGAVVFAPVVLWCAWADWRANGRKLAGLAGWDRFLFFGLPFGAFVGIATLFLELQDGHFLLHIVGVQPGHGIRWEMIGWFFWKDLMLGVPVLAIFAGIWLGLLGRTDELHSRDEGSWKVFYGVVLSAVLLACLIPRVKVGGAANNLIPIHAWLAVIFGVAIRRVSGWLGPRPGWGRHFGSFVAICALVQLLVLFRVPRGYLPTEADLEAGRALAARVADIDGEVLMPVQGQLAAAAGKRVYAHQMPVSDYAKSGLEDAVPLLESYEEAIREKRFAAIIDSNTAFLRSYLPDDLLERHYRMQGWLFEDATVLVPISGAQIRSGSLWVPRD